MTKKTTGALQFMVAFPLRGGGGATSSGIYLSSLCPGRREVRSRTSTPRVNTSEHDTKKHDAGTVTHTAAVKHCCSVTSQHTKHRTAYIHGPNTPLPDTPQQPQTHLVPWSVPPSTSIAPPNFHPVYRTRWPAWRDCKDGIVQEHRLLNRRANCLIYGIDDARSRPARLYTQHVFGVGREQERWR